MKTQRDSLVTFGRKLALGGAFLAAGTGALAQTVPASELPPLQRELTVTPGVRASLHYSDNIVLGGPGAERSGWIAEVSPYVRAAIYSERLKGEIDYTLRSFVRSESDNSWFKHNLHANGTMALSGNWLWLTGSAEVADVSALPFGTLSFDPGVYGTNSTQLRTFRLSPYATGHFGTFADYRAQYSIATSNLAGEAGALARLEQKVSGAVTSGAQFNRWGWAWYGERQSRDYASDLTLDRTSSVGKVFYIVNPELRVGGAIHYDAIDGLLSADGDRRGFGPGVNVDWNPSRRTTLSAELARQYYGNTGRLSFAHRRELFTFGIDYTRNVLTSSDASALLFDASSLYSAGGFAAGLNPIYQSLVTDSLLKGYGVPAGAGVLSDGVVNNRTLTASAAYASLRNRLVLNLYRSVRNSLIDTTFSTLGGGVRGGAALLDLTYVGELKQTGASVTWEHKLDAGTTVNLTGRHSRIDSSSPASETRLTGLEAGVQTRLTPDTTAGVAIRRTEQRSSGTATTRYDENAIYGTVDMRF